LLIGVLQWYLIVNWCNIKVKQEREKRFVGRITNRGAILQKLVY
jgi:hypothetical protein